MKVLLVEPNFPIPNKSKNRANGTHPNFVPIGLLKLASMHRKKGDFVKLVRGKQKVNFVPNQIKITSLFTYWSDYVWDVVEFYKKTYPKSEIMIGGIYATLLHDTKDFKAKLKKYRVKVHVGLHEEAEKCPPAYDMIDTIVNDINIYTNRA